MELKYRLYTPEDVPVISKLWQSSTEWGALSPALVSRHLENAPFGKPIFSVAENVETGEIVGQAVLMPSLISVKGNPVTAFRPMAAIVDHTLRVRSLNPLQHPIFRLLGHGFDEMRRRGEKLVFVLPDPRWRRVIQLMPDVQHAAFPLWSLPLPLSSSFPEYEVLGVERSGELVGVVASKQKGDRQWLICDLMAADPEAQRATLKAVCNLAHLRSTEASAAAPIHKAAVLAAPPLLPVVQELGFRRDKYDFHLFVKLFDNSMSPADVHPSLWYVSAND